MSQLYDATFHCSFCQQDETFTLTSQELSTARECQDCFRRLTLLHCTLIDSNSNLDDNNNATTTGRSDANGANNPISPNSDAVTRILTSITDSIFSTGNGPQTAQRRNALAMLIHRAMVDAGGSSGSFGGDFDGCHPDFIQHLKENQKEMTPELFYQLGLVTGQYPGIIFPTVGEFGYQLNDVIKCLLWKQQQQQQEEGPGDVDDTPLLLTSRQKHLYQYLSLVPMSDDTNTINPVVDIPENCYEVYRGLLFQPSPPTGKGLTKDGYIISYRAFAAQQQKNQLLQPPIHIFQRGEISFGLKSHLIEPYSGIAGNQPNENDGQQGNKNNDSEDAKDEQRSSISPIMLVVDTTSVWPFIMSDSTKTANQNVLGLMLPQTTTKQLALSFYSAECSQKSCEGDDKDKYHNRITASLLLLPKPNQDCSICQCSFECGEQYVGLHCKHLFHYGCLLGWIVKKNNCPSCRFKLPPKIEVDDNDDQGDMVDRGNYHNFFM